MTPEFAIAELHRAVDFYDRVMQATGDERTAVGTDHLDWLIIAARDVLRTHDPR